MQKSEITEQQAVEKALQVGVATYGNISMFGIHADDASSHWMIHFTNPKVVADGEAQHFSVQVDKRTGEVQLFRGR